MPDPNTQFTVPDEPIQPEVEPVHPIYERQASLGLERPSVILVGAGGVGCWVALALALGGVELMAIFDGDTLSTNNLNRFPLPETSVGELKSVALAHWLQTLRPKADIRARGMFDPAVHTLMADWIVCCTDSLKSRRLCAEYAATNNLNYLEVGADGERWTLSPNPPEFSTDLEDAPGYNSVPVHVGPCMMAGAAACYYILHNCRPIVSHSVNWEKGPIINSYPNLGGLKFESMNEINLDIRGGELWTCPNCEIKIEQNLILIIKHWREHNPQMGLAEAKVWAEHQLEQLNAVEPALGPDNGSEWTEEEVESHDEWAQTEEGQAILNAADPVAEATRRVDENEQTES